MEMLINQATWEVVLLLNTDMVNLIITRVSRRKIFYTVGSGFLLVLD